MDHNISGFLNKYFSKVDQCSPYSQERLHEFLTLGPLHYFIPKSIGGRFEGAKSYLTVVEAASYASVALGLTLGITGSLFIQPMVKHAQPELRNTVMSEFLESPALGGMMITEPTGGTDIFGLQTSYAQENGHLQINGVKCWGGLTGKADHWLVAARMKRGKTLSKRLHLIYVPMKSSGIEVEHYFDALGLQPITYGRTRYDNTSVPSEQIVSPTGQSGLRAIYDTLFRSRLGMPAIAAGMCKRLAEETELRGKNRFAAGNAINTFDQVQYRLQQIQNLFKMNHTLWQFTAAWMDDHDDISGDYVLVNSAKVVTSESMQMAADHALHVFASAGYKQDHYVGRSYVDCRPFQIFEGCNDVLHENTYEVIASRYGRCDLDSIEQEFTTYGLTLINSLPDTFKNLLMTDSKPSQREKVIIGQVIGWAFLAGLMHYGEKNYGADLEEARRSVAGRIAAVSAQIPYLG